MGDKSTSQKASAASKGLGAAAGAVNVVPVVGQIASAILGFASLFTGLGAKKAAKREEEERQKRLEEEANFKEPGDTGIMQDNSLSTANIQQAPTQLSAPTQAPTPMFQSPGAVDKGNNDIFDLIQGKRYG